VAETLHEVLNTEPVSPRVLNPGVPPDLDTNLPQVAWRRCREAVFKPPRLWPKNFNAS